MTENAFLSIKDILPSDIKEKYPAGQLLRLEYLEILASLLP